MRNGFSLVEVIVALTLLSIGMLAVAGSGLLAATMLRDAETEQAMMLRATSLLDSLVIHDGAGAGEIVEAHYRLTWSAGAAAVHVRVQPARAPTFDLTAVR